MKIIGLTGGIGSGKTTVAKMFAEHGVPVYFADEEAKKLTNVSKVIKRKIISAFGELSYTKGVLNREYLADIVFNDSEALKLLNSIIHPKVAKHFDKWLKKQNSAYCIKEAAILFENNAYKNYDAIILVTAPKKLRIERILTRDNTTYDRINARMSNQWSDKKKIPLADYRIRNVSLKSTKKQVDGIHEILLKL